MKSKALQVRGPLIKLMVFVLVTATATYVLATTIANKGYGDTKQYRATFLDATGLLKGDDVRIAGVRVGQVEKVEIVNRNQAQVTFTVDASHPLPASTDVKIRYRNLVGQRYLAVSQGAGSSAPLDAGKPIGTDHTEEALDLTVLFAGFQPLFTALNPSEVNQLADEIVQVLQGEGGTVESLLSHVSSLTTTLAGKDQVIGDTIDNLNSVLGTVNQRDAQLNNLIVQLRTFTGGLAADREAIGQSLTGINELSASTAGLLTEARPDLKKDIGALGALAKSLNANQGTLESTIQRFPGKVNALTRTATYGSWFNFYVCGLNAKVKIGNLTIPYTPQATIDQQRCVNS